MSLFTKLANDAFSPVDAAGNKRSVENHDAQRWGTEVERMFSAFQAGGGIIFPDLTTANASLDYGPNQMAWVMGSDAPGVYRKVGASGSGSWARLGDLPYSVIPMTNAGAGTANAIVATPLLPLPSTPGAALFTVNIVADNTGPVTINGKPWLTNVGNAFVAGGIKAGGIYLLLDNGTHFRSITDQDVSALVEQAEAAAQDAVEAASSVQPTLPTVAAAANYHPASAPTFLRTAFYDSDQVSGSGALYKNNGTSVGDLVITLDDGVTDVGYDVSGPVSAAAFGMKPGATASANMTALKAAIARLSSGMELVIPDMGGVAEIDTTGGLSEAAIISLDNVTVLIEGHIKANYSAVEANPAYIFLITGDGCKFRGSGTIEGDGEFHVNGSTSLNFPGLVYVQGDRFSCHGLRLRRPPQTAFMVVGAYADISGNLFEGGPVLWEPSTIPPEYLDNNPDYTGSAHFHIVATGGSGHTFNGNRFLPDEIGGVVVNAVFTSGVAGNSDYTRIIGNICINAWEKLHYGYGSRHIVLGNTIRAEAPYGFTDAIRCWGGYNIIAHNIIEGYRGGIQALDSVGGLIEGNMLIGMRDSGINVQHFTDAAGGFSAQVAYMRVHKNLVVRDNTSVEAIRFAIRLQGHSENHMFGCEVTENIVVGWGDGETEYAIQLNAGTGMQIQNSKCSGNFLVSCASGIKATRFAQGEISRNRFYDISGIGIEVIGGDNIEVDGNLGSSMGTYTLSMGTSGDAPTNVRFTDNRMFGATNIGIRNYGFGSSTENWAEGNQWTAKALMGSSTLSAAASTTITHGGIAAHATIQLLPTSQAFAALAATKGVFTGLASGDFAVATGDGTNAAGGEVFRWKVNQ